VQWIYTKKSPPLQEIATTALRHSINLYSEAFLKSVGLKHFNFASTDNGLKVFEKFLTSLGLQKDTFYLFDGSGLSHKNLISAAGVTKALEALKAEESFEAFLSSIPKPSNYFAFADLADCIGQRVYL
jgi:D-alanyl-D-alanine carboxypeptidase/D-alanyl-D-alanine-endopeptidase (penicillin-binding protein 4)